MRWILRLQILATLLTSACVSSSSDTPETRNEQASLELARQMVGHGEYQRAVQFLAPRSRKEDAPLEVHMLLGLSFVGLNNPEAATKSFSTLLKLDPNNDDARLNLAYTHIMVGRHADARTELEKILKRGKYTYIEKVFLNIGLTYMQEKRCDKAIPKFKEAIEIDPTYSAPYYNMGKCHLNAGRLSEARASFQRAVDFCPGCVEPRFELASVSHRMGDRQKALSLLDFILKSKPDATIERRALIMRKQISR